MRHIEHVATFPAFGKWGAVADGQETFALMDIPSEAYSSTVERLEDLRRNGSRVLDLSVSIERDAVAGMIRVTARGVTD